VNQFNGVDVEGLNLPSQSNEFRTQLQSDDAQIWKCSSQSRQMIAAANPQNDYGFDPVKSTMKLGDPLAGFLHGIIWRAKIAPVAADRCVPGSGHNAFNREVIAYHFKVLTCSKSRSASKFEGSNNKIRSSSK